MNVFDILREKLEELCKVGCKKDCELGACRNYENCIDCITSKIRDEVDKIEKDYLDSVKNAPTGDLPDQLCTNKDCPYRENETEDKACPAWNGCGGYQAKEIQSNDLISRSALIEVLTKYKFGAIQRDVEREYIKEVMLMFVKEQPVAYDAKKVEAEVLEITERIFNYCEEIDLNIPEEERSGYNMLPDIRRLRECVRNGGKE